MNYYPEIQFRIKHQFSESMKFAFKNLIRSPYFGSKTRSRIQIRISDPVKPGIWNPVKTGIRYIPKLNQNIVRQSFAPIIEINISRVTCCDVV